jgi:hypothetical protein
MDPEIILVIIALGVLTMVIFYVRSKIIDSKILKHSRKVASLLMLNQSFMFHSVKKKIVIRKHYDNKSNYTKIEPAYLMSAYIRDNIDDIASLIAKIKENRENKHAYEKKIEAVFLEPVDTVLEYLKISNKEYLYREKKLLRKLIIHPVTDCILCVYMSYSSPKGKVNLSKSNCFSFNDIFTSFESVSRSKLDKYTYSKLALVERGEISDSLRYDILKRDSFKCTICGASSNEGARLHVDHILPIAKHGKSIPSNLRTLCERCNIGKSDKLEEHIISDEILDYGKSLIETEEPIKNEKVSRKEIIPESDVVEDEIISQLKSLRSELSQKYRLYPVYNVFNNETLMSIIDKKPTSLDELSSIKGFGEKKIELFGSEIVEFVNNKLIGKTKLTSDVDQKLFELLLVERVKIAKFNKLSEDDVYSDKVAGYIAKMKPKDREALAKVYGIKKENIDIFGDYLLRIIYKYIDTKK